MKNICKYGILGGIIAAAILVMMVFYMKNNPGEEPNAILGFLGMLLAFVFLVLGIKQERKSIFDKITFKNAFLTGLGIAFVISTIYVLSWLVIHYYFFPDFMEKYGEMVLKNSSSEELQAKTIEINQMKEWYKSPLMVILLTYIEIFPLGIVVSLIAGLILKKNN